MKQDRQSEPIAPAPYLVLTTEGMAWLGVAVLIGGLGWWKSISLVLLLAYVMLVLLVINGILAQVSLRRVRATRVAAAPVFAGEEAEVRVDVANQGLRTATLVVEDRLAGQPLRWLVNRLAGGETTNCRGRRRCLARGRHRPPLRVASSFPLGLLQAERSDPSPTEVVVLPLPGNADPDGLRRWIMRYSGGDGRVRKVLRRVTTDQADVRGVRPYRPGDPIRSIHWRSTARRGALMVREYDTAPAPDLVLIVEPWLPVNPSAAERVALEAALSLAATIARTWSRVHGTKLVIAVAGEPDSVRWASGSDLGVREALTPLADVVGDASFAPLPAGQFDRTLARAARLVISSRAGSPYAEAMSRVTGRRFAAICANDDLPWYRPPRVRLADQRSRSSESQAGHAD